MKVFCKILSAGLVVLLFAMCKKTKHYPPVVPVPNPANNSVLQEKVYSQAGLTLTFKNNDPLFDTTIRNKMVSNFFAVYPKLISRFNLNATNNVVFQMDTAYVGVAAAGGGKVTYSASYYRSNAKDIDVVTHEVMHLVQAYPAGAGPGWITEGIADYVRYKYGIDNASAGWSLPAFASSQSYTNSYRITARFLVWLENHVKTSIVNELDNTMRLKTYSANTWKDITGKTVDELWQSYSQNPAL